MVEKFLICCGKNHFKINNTPLITSLTRNNGVLHQKHLFWVRLTSNFVEIWEIGSDVKVVTCRTEVNGSYASLTLSITMDLLWHRSDPIVRYAHPSTGTQYCAQMSPLGALYLRMRITSCAYPTMASLWCHNNLIHFARNMYPIVHPLWRHGVKLQFRKLCWVGQRRAKRGQNSTIILVIARHWKWFETNDG